MDASAAATLSLSPPPSFSRMPPDGHEFPPNYQETCPEPTVTQELSLKMQPPPPLPSTAPPIPKKKLSVSSLEKEIESTPPIRKYSSCSNASSTGTDDSFKPSRGSSTWRNDEKSVRSVRDKIAMFSNVTDETPISPAIVPPSFNSHRKLNRFKSSEDVFFNNDCVDASSGNLPSGKLFSRSVISVDKVASNSFLPENNQRSTSPMKKLPTYSSMVDMSQVSCGVKQNQPNIPKSLEYTSRTQSSVDLSSSSSAYSSESPDSSLTPTVPTPFIGYSSTLPRKSSAKESERKVSLSSPKPESYTQISTTESKSSLSRAMSFNGTNKLHSRSQSLVDVNSIPLNRFVPKSTSEEARRASLNALIEQRRRSISKLRGLVIPEKVSEDVVPQTIPDLPEIKSRDSILSKVPEEPTKKSSFSSYANSRYGSNTYTSPTNTTPPFSASITSNSNLSSLSWKTQPVVADIPKYSPAFKRKSLAVYGTPSLASSVSSSLSSSREELRPIFDNTVTNSVKSPVTPPPPPSKPPRTVNNISRNSLSSPTAVTSLSPTLCHYEPPKSLESITSPTQSDLSFEFVSSSGSSPDIKMMRNGQYEEKINQKNGNYIKTNEPQVMPVIKLNKHQNPSDLRRSGGEESDNDSAVSSSRSSISHDFSPPQSPIPDLQHRLDDEHMGRSHLLLSPSNSAGSSDRRTLRRTLSSETTASAASSTASTLTSGSQASCSSSGSDSLNRRVLKAQSVEAINRKNVLSSARFSSGQDLKIGSPLIQRKFEENEGFVNESVITDVELSDETKVKIETENFIERLNGTLKKEIVTEVLNEETNSSEVTHYHMSSSNKEFRTTKVAYLEVEVSDGGNFSSQDDSSFIDSNPSSMEHLDNDPIPAPRDKLQMKESSYLSQEIFTADNVDGKTDQYTTHSSNQYNVSTTVDLFNENILDNSTQKKPFIKRLSKENFNNNGSSTSDDDSCKTNDSQSTKENLISPKQNSVPVVPPKPTERKIAITASLLHSDSKESSVSSDDFVSCTSKQDTPTTLSPKESPSSSSTGKIPTASARNINNRRSVSVNDIRKAFEKAEIALSGKPKTGIINGNGHMIPSHARVSSLDSTTSEDSCAPTPTHYGSITNLQKEQQFGSITSLASSTSLISQQELQQLIEDANQALEETGGCSHEVVVVILHRDTAGGSVGITLAGGADYNCTIQLMICAQELQQLIEDANQALEETGGCSHEVVVVILHRDMAGGSVGITLAGGADYNFTIQLMICAQELQQLIEDANQALEETGGCSHEVVVVILHRDTAGGSVGITLAGGADYNFTIQLMICAQELQQLIEDANQALEETGGCSHEVVVVILHRDMAGGSVGITLAGGADYNFTIQLMICVQELQQLIEDANQALEETGGCSHEVVVVILHRDMAGGSVGITLAEGADYNFTIQLMICVQELQQLIEDANQALEETGGCSHEVVVVILHRDTAGGSVGITLAGGADYEAKEITVHKVLAGSPADRDGRIQKGDRILSINGRSMKGVSHRESLAILKAPRPEVVLVVSRWRPDGYIDPQTEDPLVLSLRNNLRPPRIPEQTSADSDKEEVVESEVARGPPLTVTLVKDGAGLGFSLEGGKDSPLGDQPLTIKKIFTGGCAEKSGQLFAGDELLSVNGTDVTSMSRIEAWGLMKRLSDGKVVLSLRHKTVN